MTEKHWDAVDAYFGAVLLKPDPVLDAALERSRAGGLPGINVAPNQGAFLQMLAASVGARRILEVGTLGGYSTIWLARALPPDGRLISLEIDPMHAEVARANIAAAGLSEIVEVRVGRALDSLPMIAAAGEGPFDFVFIDADKSGNADYFDWALKMSRPGTLIVVDNVVRGGAVADAASRDASVRGSRKVLERIGSEPRVAATAIQTVGVKGYDGLAIARVL